MTEREKKVLNNEISRDKELALIALSAVKQKDEELLKKVKNHPNADWKTLCTSIMY